MREETLRVLSYTLDLEGEHLEAVRNLSRSARAALICTLIKQHDRGRCGNEAVDANPPELSDDVEQGLKAYLIGAAVTQYRGQLIRDYGEWRDTEAIEPQLRFLVLMRQFIFPLVVSKPEQKSREMKDMLKFAPQQPIVRLFLFGDEAEILQVLHTCETEEDIEFPPMNDAQTKRLEALKAPYWQETDSYDTFRQRLKRLGDAAITELTQLVERRVHVSEGDRRDSATFVRYRDEMAYYLKQACKKGVSHQVIPHVAWIEAQVEYDDRLVMFRNRVSGVGGFLALVLTAGAMAAGWQWLQVVFLVVLMADLNLMITLWVSRWLFRMRAVPEARHRANAVRAILYGAD